MDEKGATVWGAAKVRGSGWASESAGYTETLSDMQEKKGDAGGG